MFNIAAVCEPPIESFAVVDLENVRLRLSGHWKIPRQHLGEAASIIAWSASRLLPARPEHTTDREFTRPSKPHSNRGVPRVHRHERAGHVAGSVACQKQHDSRNLVRVCQATHGYALLCKLGEELV